MKDSDNIIELVEVHPDYMGLIFHEKSPRNVAYDFIVPLPDGMNKVGVFVNETEGFILDRVERFDIKYVQLHGNESSHFCKQLKNSPLGRGLRGGLKIIKAFNIHEGFDFIAFFLSGGIKWDIVNEIKNFSHPQFIGVDINSGFEIEPGLKNVELIKEFKNELFS